MKFFPLLCSLAFAFASLAQAADPASEMASFSVFGKVDPAELARSGIKIAAGTPMTTLRDLSVQSCFVIARPPAEVVQAMKRFDPTAHRELKVFLHVDLPASPSPGNFSRLQNPPNDDAYRTLAAATEKMSPDLQLNRAEVQKFSAGESFFNFWSGLLAKRAQSFVSSGAAAQPPYDRNGPAIQPAREFSALVRQESGVNRQFGSFIGATGLTGGRPSLKPDLYWEMLEVEDAGVLTLGASCTRPTAGGGYQAADGLYFASGGYYVALTLYQMWPVNIAGRASTLVWRGDFTSAASLGDLHGVERLASEGAMKKDISRAAEIFKDSAER
jgi:hypothetical protein